MQGFHTVQLKGNQITMRAFIAVVALLILVTGVLLVADSQQSSAASSPSGASMPVGNLNGWKQSYTQDFTTDAAKGRVGNVYGADMRGYSGFSDTSKNGTYAPDKVLSVSNGILDFHVRTENGKRLVASPIPMGYDGQTYGRYSVRFRTDNANGYKIAFLLWPSSDTWNDGEIDWPEGNLGGKMYPASAKKGSYRNGAMTFDPPARVSSPTDSTGWHTATTEWTPGSVKWYWDNTLIGQTTDPAGVPTKPMRWTLQAETSTDGTVPSSSTSGHIQVDWLTAYAYSPNTQGDQPATPPSTGGGTTTPNPGTGGGSGTTPPAPVVKTTSFNDTDTGTGTNQFNFNGTWYTDDNVANAYQKNNHFTNKAGAYYTFKFNGSQVKLYSEKRDVQGIAGISIDGGAETMVDNYVTGRQDQQLVYSSPVLNDGEHTIKVRATGTKSKASKDVYLTADRVDVVSGGTAPTTDPTLDTTPPSVPSTLAGTATSATNVDLTWKAATDNVGVDHYNIVRDGVVIGTAVGTTYSDKKALPQTKYGYKVVAVDVAKNESTASNAVTVTTPALPDTSAPTVPANLKGQAVSTTQINLTWSASTDNTGVAKYLVYRNGTQIASVTTASYGDASGLKAGTSYSYTVKAVDAAGNTSPASATAAVSTQAAPVTPTNPAPSTSSGCTANGVVAPCMSGNTTTGTTGYGTPKFADEFNGSSVDSTKWATNWFGGTNMNGYVKSAANVKVTGGNAVLGTAADQSGAILTSNPYNGGGINGGFEMQVGQYAEARIYLPGNGTTIYNWPAWWTDPQSWPSGGEADIVEGLGTASTNYHSNSGASNFFVGGVWSNAYHTYGLLRQSGKNTIYWDGKVVRTYATDDGGAPEYLILTSGGDDVTGAAADMKVDYVRVWQK